MTIITFRCALTRLSQLLFAAGLLVGCATASAFGGDEWSQLEQEPEYLGTCRASIDRAHGHWYLTVNASPPVSGDYYSVVWLSVRAVDGSDHNLLNAFVSRKRRLEILQEDAQIATGRKPVLIRVMGCHALRLDP